MEPTDKAASAGGDVGIPKKVGCDFHAADKAKTRKNKGKSRG